MPLKFTNPMSNKSSGASAVTEHRSKVVVWPIGATAVLSPSSSR